MTSARAARSRAPPTTRRRSRRVERVPKVNDIVDIWWAVDKTFYRGRLTDQLHNTTSFRILYDDGETEDLDLVNEHWKFAHDDRPQPDADEIVDVVLDGSHQTSQQDPKSHSPPKKAKQKPSKPSTTRLKSHQTSDDERDKDYVEETSTPEHPTRQTRSKVDSEKPKKRQKKQRRQSTASDKTSTASRPPTRTSSESRQVAESRPDQPESTSQLSRAEQSKADKPGKPPDTTSPEPKNAVQNGANHAQFSREQTDGPLNYKNDTQTAHSVPTPPPAKTTSATLEIDTSDKPITHAPPGPAKAPSEPHKSDSATKATDTAHQKSTTSPASGQLMADTPATPSKPTSVPHNRIDSQRDLAIIQTVPSFLPPDKARLPRSSDPASFPRHAVITDGTGTSIVPYNQASKPGVSAVPKTTAPNPQNQESSDIEMEDDIDVEKGPATSAVPVKVAIRPKNTQADDVGTEGANRGQADSDSRYEVSGTARNANAVSKRRENTVRKRGRESGEATDDAIEEDANGETRQKRPKPSNIPDVAAGPTSQEIANPLTHIPDHDPTLTTLVNRRLNPIERHLRLLAEDVHILSNETEDRRRNSQSLVDMIQRMELDMRNELNALRDELRSVQTERREKQEEIVGLLQELKAEVASISRSRADEYSGPGNGRRGANANGYNMPSTRYQQSPIAPGRTLSMRQLSDERAPLQDSRLSRGRPARMGVEGPGMNSDDDVNLSPRRVAAPMSNPVRGPIEMNVNKVSQPPSDSKDRIISVVARQITVWLLETPHEYQTRGNVPVAEWAKRTSANAFENVATRLSHFDNYVQAHQTLSTSLGNDAAEMSWFTNPHNRLNINRARRNYAAWDPPPTDSEWHCECVLLAEAANAFHLALETHVWANEDDLSAAVNITNEACASYGFRRDVPARHPNSGIHVTTSQPRRSGHTSHHNGAHFVRTSK